LCLLLAAWPSAAWAQRPPEESLRTLRVPDDLEIELFASEPMITNPAAIDVDTHGRVWVAEIQWYRGAAKIPPADKIKVLEDTDGDGRADKVTVFADGVFAPMSICVAGHRVYVATSPDLWVYEDRDGDLRADGPPQKLLTGFGGHNHDHGAHSLVLGPDHKWWMAHGDAGFRVTGTDGSKIESRWGAMLRGELDGSRLELIADNFRNPYEIAVSSFGESFCSDNDNDGNFSVRICWILEGGDYGWFGRPPFARNELDARLPPGTPFRETWHFRGYQPGYVPGTLVTGFGSPCGMCFYEGDAFGPKYKNVPWHADAGPREVRIYPHVPHGYGMRATLQNVVTTEGDNYFRPVDVCAAPDGTLYLADWYDGGVGGHAYNDPDRGRIYRLRPRGQRPTRIGKPGPYESIADAIDGLRNPNLATQFLAREKLLAEGQRSIPALAALLDDPDPNYQARALWVLDRIGSAARQHVVRRLQHDEAAQRALAVRILRRHGSEFAAQIRALARDPSAEVRREVLLSLRGSDDPETLRVLVELAETWEEGGDRYQLETLAIAARGRQQELFAALAGRGDRALRQFSLLQLLDAQGASDLLARSLAGAEVDRRAVELLLNNAVTLNDPQAGKLLLRLVDNPQASAQLRQLALDRLAANLDGTWSSLKESPELRDLLVRLLSDAALRVPALRLIRERGIAGVQEVLSLVAAPQDAVPPDVRLEAIAAAVRIRLPETAAALQRLLDNPDARLQQAALDGLVDLQQMRVLRELLAAGTLPATLQTRAVNRLLESTPGALALLRLIDERALPQDVQQSVIAAATRHPDANVRLLYERFIPEDQRPKKLGEAISAQAILALRGDAARGEKIFFQSSAAQCKNCHQVQGAGETLGPDLSQIGKKYERATLLETILEPSKAIAPEYYVYLVETSQGHVHAGFLVERNEKEVILRDSKNQLIRIAASDVETMERQTRSMMPELVLRDVTAQDAADLLAYLESLKSSIVQVGRFRVVGPFNSADGRGIDTPFGPERRGLAEPDLTAQFQTLGGRSIGWDEVVAQRQQGGLVVDQVKYNQSQGFRGEHVTNYFLVYLDSAAQQPATLLVGSDDSVRVWLNGQVVHTYRGSRAVQPGQDKVDVQLQSGRNVLVLKVENGNGPGGVSLAIRSESFVSVSTH
jgi:putative membrane-bound dehydrogenase-like protein